MKRSHLALFLGLVLGLLLTGCTTPRDKGPHSILGQPAIGDCSVTLSASPGSPQNISSSITLTAAATCTSGTPEYKFYKRDTAGNWSVLQDWSASATFAWNTTSESSGTYLLQAWGRRQGETLAYEGTSPSVTYNLRNPVVSTLAGSGVQGFADGNGTAAQFNQPSEVVVDNTGNTYIADANNHRIRKITPAGVVTTIAGTGTFGFAEGTGVTAQFFSPTSIAIDPSGQLYISDQGNQRIRKVAYMTNGTCDTTSNYTGYCVTTVAGNGTAGYIDGTAATAQFRSPKGLAIDSAGNIYLADKDNNRLRKLTNMVNGTCNGTTGYTGYCVTTIAGDGTAAFADGTGVAAKFNSPYGLTMSAAGDLYVGDTNNHRIRKVTPAGVVTTFAGEGTAGFADGAANTAKFDQPYGLSFDSVGNLFVADSNNKRIRQIDSNGNVTTLTGTGVIGSTDGAWSLATFKHPVDVAIDSAGDFYIADYNGHTLRKISEQVATSCTMVSGSFAPTSPTNVGNTITLTLTPTCPSGTTPEYKIYRRDPSGAWSVQRDWNTSASYSWDSTGMTIGAHAFQIWVRTSGSSNSYDAASSVINYSLHNIVVSTLAGNGSQGYVDDTGSAARFTAPTGIALDASGDLYVADQNNHRIRKVTSAGVVTTVAGDGTAGFADGTAATAQFNSPTGIALDSSGNVFVVDKGNNRVRKIDTSGNVTTIAGTGANGSLNGVGASATFKTPYGLAIDTSGNLYVAEPGNHIIRKLTNMTNGTCDTTSNYTGFCVSTLAGNGTAGFADGPAGTAQFDNPYDVTVDGSGNVYVADQNNSRIRKITPAGVVSTYAGDGTAGHKDGPAASAQFSGPRGISIDGAGNLYIADPGNPRVRKIDTSGNVTTLAGLASVGMVDGALNVATFNSIHKIVADSSGNLYIADTNNHSIRKYGEGPPPPGSCAYVSATTSLPSPQPLNMSVTITMTPTCSGTATAEYKIYRKSPAGSWSILRDWNTSNSYAWDATGTQTGTHQLQVWVRRSGSVATYEGASSIISFQRTASVQTCTGVSFTTSPSSPQNIGTSVTLTMTPNCTTGTTPEYKVYRRETSGSWTLAQDWNTSSTYAWDTTGAVAGSYLFQVWIRSNTSSAAYEAASSSATYQLQTPAP